MFKPTAKLGYQTKITSPKGGYWYKEDLRGGEALAEVLVSTFLRSCNYLGFQDFVPYDFKYTAPNTIELHTCVSPNFLQEEEQFISFKDLLSLVHSPTENLVGFDSKLDFIDSVFQQTVGQSFRFELLRLLTLDVMFRNTDRHLSNFGIILVPNGSVRFSPIFDNGLALGVSEGAYFDLDNLIKGFSYKIKPYELAVSTLTPQIDTSYFQFDVCYFVGLVDKNIPKSNLLLGFLNLLVHYYPKDYYGRNTKEVIESVFGKFTKKRFLES
jgi:hipA-like C-terminal domain